MKDHYCVFDRHLHIGASVRHISLVKWKLAHGAGQFTIFLIIPAQNGIDQLDVIHCALLKQKYYRDHPVHVYGIAGGYEEAIDMIVTISDLAVQDGMPGELLAYLQKDETDESEGQ